MANVDGEWACQINTPMGAQKFDLNIQSDGDSFTGTASGAMGNSDVSGKVDGDRLIWSMSITQPMPLTVDADAAVTGDSLAGDVKVGAFGTMKMTGTRK